MAERPDDSSSREPSTSALRSTLSHTPPPRESTVSTASPESPTPTPRSTGASWRGRVASVVGPAASVVAVVWGLWTIRRLVRVIRSLVADDGSSAEVVRILRFQNVPDGPIVDGFGLTFAGSTGLAIALGQILLIALSVIAVAVPVPRVARIPMLVGGGLMAAVWAGSHAWVLAWSFDIASLFLTGIHVAGVLAMLVVLGWRWRRDR